MAAGDRSIICSLEAELTRLCKDGSVRRNINKHNEKFGDGGGGGHILVIGFDICGQLQQDDPYWSSTWDQQRVQVPSRLAYDYSLPTKSQEVTQNIEHIPGGYRHRTATTTYETSSNNRTLPGVSHRDGQYIYRYRGPIREYVDYTSSYTTSRRGGSGTSRSGSSYATSYASNDAWLAFINAAADGRNYVVSHDLCISTGSCYPSTGDLVIGREKRLSATSTCGQKTRQFYCDHGANSAFRHEAPRACMHTCDSDPKSPNYFGIENIVKLQPDLRKRWQSEPGVMAVSIQLDFEAEFHFTHLIMIFHTFRPKAMVIEKSNDMGKTFRPIAYFAHNCAETYPHIPLAPKKKLLDVVCEEKYSQLLPKHGGSVLYSNLNPRDEATKKENFKEIEKLVSVTNLRFKFQQLHTLGDMNIGDNEAYKQKYYYAVRSLIVRGSCSCYGHAESCIPFGDEPHVPKMIYGKCACMHNTEGENCNRCKPLYNDLKWEAASRDFPECKKCECNQHSDSCEFDENLFIANGKRSGGRCLNCLHNTAGPNCELCEDFYYRNPKKPLTDPDICQPCNCNKAGSLEEGRCEQYDENGFTAGKCRCRDNVHERNCGRCKAGFWNLTQSNPLGCQACECDPRGIYPGSQGCNEKTGECSCKENVTGQLCDACAPGHYGLEEGQMGCKPCDCDRGGSINPDQCDLENGQCECKPGIKGRKCDQIEDGFFVPLPDHLIHEAEVPDEQRNTKIIARAHYAPSNLRDFSGLGFMDLGPNGMIELRYPEIPWTGEYNIFVRGDPKSHDQELEVTVIRENPLRHGSPCKKTGTQEEPRDIIRLKTASQDPSPVMQVCLEKDSPVRVRLEVPSGFSPHSGSQLLIDSVVLMPDYRKLDVYPKNTRSDLMDYCIHHVELYGTHSLYEECKKIFYPAGMAVWNQAFKCECNAAGSTSNVCNSLGGQCTCKVNVVGRQCEMCDTVSWGLEDNEECIPCECDHKGSLNQFCDPRSGKCNCRENVFGDHCDQCARGYWGDPFSCLKCECNDRAETCNPKTGECIDCRENTSGAHCERCAEGYYGDPLRGIACRPCLCPETPEFGPNHAVSCHLSSTNEMYCQCKPGYKGEKCDECENNFYGDPTRPGDGCRPCECNGNIDLSLEGNCDPVTGDCLRCLYNSEGIHCERCKEGHWKNGTRCDECSCNPSGTQVGAPICDQKTGKCNCLPNVEGIGCDRCKPAHWNFNSGKGCEPCACNTHGTIDGSEECNVSDGQCHCIAERGGRRCDLCSTGYHGVPDSKCYKCECDRYEGAMTAVCDAATGHCVCKQGMTGPRCDQCARGFKGRSPKCEPCDNCFASWDVIIGELDAHTRNLIDTAKLIKQTGTSGDTREFKEIEDYLANTREILARANITGLNLSQRQTLLDELKALLDQVEGKLAQAENMYSFFIEDSLTLSKRVAQLDGDIETLRAKVKKLEEDMTTLQEQNVMGAFNLIKKNVQEAKEYQTKGHEVRKIIEDSSSKRDAASRLLTRGRGQFHDIHQRNEQMLTDLNRDIGHLENEIPRINRYLCASDTSVEGCKDKCGGVGCDHCGDQFGCTEAAVQKAKHALQMARDVQEIVREKQARATHMRDDIETARSQANQAHTKAMEAYTAVTVARDDATNAVTELKNLLQEIEDLLKKAVATPSEILQMAKDCLERKVQLTPQQIQDLSAQIQDTIRSLSDIDRILKETENDKLRTAALKNKADKVESDAQRILSSAEAVYSYLEDARQAQNEARGDLDTTKRETSDVKDEIRELDDRGNRVKTRANDLLRVATRLSDRLKSLQRNKTDVNYKVGNLNSEFEAAQKQADQAHGLSQQLSDRYQEAVHEIERKTLSDNSNKGLADNLRQRAQRLNADIQSRLSELQNLEDTFIDNEKKVKGYDDLIDALMREMDEHQSYIDGRARYYQKCTK
ncbi:laminin subunit beta-2-like isoform X2 [Varroa jacobsoni]|uniref:laminin subunit beta-2-like isoform X2 n=1 Tax=Varroa jacobsoni TaxID=62625 RepID=UPI000BF9D6E5|nr:laminin subunit beta-2-like isoform X2 [Varroa jacobsoni]